MYVCITATMAGSLHSEIEKLQLFKAFHSFSKTIQGLCQFSETQGLFKAGLEFKAGAGTLIINQHNGMLQWSPSQQHSISQPTHTVVSILSNFMFSRSSSSSVSNSSSFPSLPAGDGSFSIVMATAAAVLVLGGEADITGVCLKSDSAAGERCLSVTTGLLITVGFGDGIWTQRDKHWGCLLALTHPKAKIITCTWMNTV